MARVVLPVRASWISCELLPSKLSVMAPARVERHADRNGAVAARFCGGR